MLDRPTVLTRLRPEYNPLELLSDRGRRMLFAAAVIVGLAVYAWLFVLVAQIHDAPASETPAPPAAAAAPTAGAKATAPPAPRQPTAQQPAAQQPSAAQPRAQQPATRTYRVTAGDTLSSVALRHGVDYGRIATDNQLANPNLIHPGQTLRIGQPTPGVHLIEPGETLSDLAKHSGLTIRQLRALNPWITNPNRITAGLGLRLRS